MVISFFCLCVIDGARGAFGDAGENAAIFFDLGDDAGTVAFHFQAVKSAEVEAFAKLRGFAREKLQKAHAVAGVGALPFVKDFAAGGADDEFIYARGLVSERRGDDGRD